MKGYTSQVSIILLLASQAFGDAPSPKNQPPATPVTVARSMKRDFMLEISGPGKTAALESQKIVAPFAGTLVSFGVSPGDLLEPNQIVAKILSETSVAELEGARQMLKSARSTRERRDAKRALKLAERNAVTTTIRVSEPGVVVSIGADEGVVVAKDQELINFAPRDSIDFLADIDQTHLGKIHPGQTAEVKLAGSARPLPGRVHAVLPAGSPADLSSPVRIDFVGTNPAILGVFGTARIRVGELTEVPAVPEASVLRNDVMGTTRVAAIGPGERAHWIDVKTGVAENGWVEVLSPKLEPGTPVIVDGQVGLAENAPVRARK